MSLSVLKPQPSKDRLLFKADVWCFDLPSPLLFVPLDQWKSTYTVVWSLNYPMGRQSVQVYLTFVQKQVSLLQHLFHNIILFQVCPFLKLISIQVCILRRNQVTSKIKTVSAKRMIPQEQKGFPRPNIFFRYTFYSFCYITKLFVCVYVDYKPYRKKLFSMT